MSELALVLVADYGVTVLFLVTFLSCLALPVPSSLVMLAAGGFAATEDLVLIEAGLAAYAGAVLGDNLGYWIARGLGTRLGDWLSARPGRARLRSRAEAFMTRWGGSSVFFSCWLVAPLGPYVNYVSGLTRFGWWRFALWGAAGEIVWVGLYVGLGYIFADQITNVADVAGNLSGFLAAGVLAAGLGVWLWRASHKHQKALAEKALANPGQPPISKA